MTVTYEWTLQGDGSLECAPSLDGQTNVVRTVHWRLNGTDGPYAGTVCGAQALTYASGETFTAYPDLTLDQVTGWVRDALGAEQVAALEQAVADQIAAQANPPVVTLPLPWENGS